MSKNRELHEFLGLCWHSPAAPSMSHIGSAICKKCKQWLDANPNYAADPRLVLREMIKKRGGKGWINFIDEIGQMEYDKETDTIRVSLILDATGKLRDAAWEWLRKEATDEPT